MTRATTPIALMGQLPASKFSRPLAIIVGPSFRFAIMGIVRAAVAFTVSILALFSPQVGMAHAVVSAIPNVAGTPLVHPVTHPAFVSHGGQGVVPLGRR